MIVAALVLPETTVGMIAASATRSPGDPGNAQFGVDNGHGVVERKCKAAERKLKALFAPRRPPPRPPGRPAARQSAVAHGLDKPRCGGDRWQRGFYRYSSVIPPCVARKLYAAKCHSSCSIACGACRTLLSRHPGAPTRVLV